jgi:hypothetical protein
MTDQIAIKFEEFHNKHPWVYEKLKLLAFELRNAGVKHYGIGGLFEILRYQASLTSNDEEGFKLNNNYRALYARMLAKNEPALRDFFSFRLRNARGTQHLAPEVDAWDNILT